MSISSTVFLDIREKREGVISPPPARRRFFVVTKLLVRKILLLIPKEHHVYWIEKWGDMSAFASHLSLLPWSEPDSIFVMWPLRCYDVHKPINEYILLQWQAFVPSLLFEQMLIRRVYKSKHRYEFELGNTLKCVQYPRRLRSCYRISCLVCFLQPELTMRTPAHIRKGKSHDKK